MSSSQEGATAIQVGRIGLAGAIIGAIIGGIGTFLGTYFTLREQRDTEYLEARRIAYIAVVTKGSEYRQLLIDLGAEASRNDQATYTKDRETLSSTGTSLYSAFSAVYLVSGNPELRKKATAAATVIFSHPYIPRSEDEFSSVADEVQRTIRDGDRAMAEFIQAAQADLLQE